MQEGMTYTDMVIATLVIMSIVAIACFAGLFIQWIIITSINTYKFKKRYAGWRIKGKIEKEARRENKR